MSSSSGRLNFVTHSRDKIEIENCRRDIGLRFCTAVLRHQYFRKTVHCCKVFSQVLLTRDSRGLWDTRRWQWIDSVLVKSTVSSREAKLYHAVVWWNCLWLDVLYRDIRLNCFSVCSWISSFRDSGSRHVSPAQCNVESRWIVKLSGWCLPVIRHSAHHDCVASLDDRLNNFTHWIYNNDDD